MGLERLPGGGIGWPMLMRGLAEQVSQALHLLLHNREGDIQIGVVPYRSLLFWRVLIGTEFQPFPFPSCFQHKHTL